MLVSLTIERKTLWVEVEIYETTLLHHRGLIAFRAWVILVESLVATSCISSLVFARL